MLIKRRSMMTGIEREREIPITHEQYAQWSIGKKIQQVAPHLTPSEREFIMTGMTDEEFDQACGPEE